MPVLPNFSAFSPAPNNATAFLGGQASAQRDTEIQNQADQALAHLAMQQQQLAQAAQQSQMELQAKEAMHQQEILRQQQELQIKAQYEQQMIGIHQMDLEQKKAKLDMDTQMAAQQYQARKSIEEAPPDQRIDSILRNSAAAGISIPAGVFDAYTEANDPNKAYVPKATKIEGLPAGSEVYSYPISRNQRQVIDAARGGRADEQLQMSAERLALEKAKAEFDKAQKEKSGDLAERKYTLSADKEAAEKLQKEFENTLLIHSKDDKGEMYAAWGMRKEPREMTDAQRKIGRAWIERAAKLAKMAEGVGAAPAPSAPEPAKAPATSGTNSATAGKYKVTW